MAALEAVPTLKAAASCVGRMLRAAASLLWTVVAWVLYKSLQATVGGVFIALILAQTAVAGVLRWLRPSAAFAKVQAARQAQDAGITAATAAAGPKAAGPAAAEPTAPQPQKALHIFPDPKHGHDSLVCQLVGPYMRMYGRHAIANSQLFNPEYIHFYVPGLGALPYVVSDVFNRVAIVGTGEPLAARADWRALTQLFLQEFPNAYFYHITEEYADLLHDMGYWINGCGTETTLQVQSWAYSSKTRTIRASARSARDSGVRVRELKPEELTDDMRAKLQHDVTGCWLQQKAIADRELRVFVRGVDYDHLELRDGIRIFVAEAYDPAVAPPANVDPVLQGAALNAKPPKPPRVKSSASLRNRESSSGQELSAAAKRAKLPHSKSEGCALCSSSSGGGGGSSSSGGGNIANALSMDQPVPLAPWLQSTNSTTSIATVSSIGPSDAGTQSPTAAAAAGAGKAAAVSSPLTATAFQLSSLHSDGGSASSGSTSPMSDCMAFLDLQHAATTSQAAAAAGAAQGTSKAAAATALTATQASGCKSVKSVRVQEHQAHHSLPKQQPQQQPWEQRVQFPDVVTIADQRSGGAVGTSSESAPAQPPAVLGAPELVGFVLLDPLWEGGQEVGYVTSIMRMKRSAHQGTLKLLIEDIVSNLRKEGKRELAFGFAPLWNMNDSVGRRRLHWMRWVALYLYHCANNVYAFKNLAFSKTRYGAGLNAKGTAFNDPNVSLTYVYMAAPTYMPGWNILELFGFFSFVGLISDPINVYLKLVGLKKGGENLK